MKNPFNNEEVQTTEIQVSENKDFVANLSNAQTMFCSVIANTPAEKAKLFNIINAPEKRLADTINMTLEITDIYCETVECVNENTGETTMCPRIVLIDKNGVGYQAVSVGIYSALKKIMSFVGNPPWDNLPLIVKQITKGDRKILTFEIDTKNFK